MKMSISLFAAIILTFLSSNTFAQIVPPDGNGDGGINPDQVTLRWPSDDFPTLQSAIDALPAEGGILRISRGTHEVPEPVFVRNKNIVIKGAGCGDDPSLAAREIIGPMVADGTLPESILRRLDRVREGHGTHLVGPESQRDVEFDQTVALFNFVNAGGMVSNIRLSGHDAGVSGTADDASGATGPALVIQNTCIEDTVRGVAWASSSPLSIENAIVRNASWNGLSVKSLGEAPRIHIFNFITLNSRNACMVFIGVFATTKNVDCVNNGSGGGILAVNSLLSIIGPGVIINSDGPGIATRQSGLLQRGQFLVVNSTAFGVYLDEPLYSELKNINIIDTKPFSSGPRAGNFGDGITVSLKTGNNARVDVVSSNISNSARAGLSNFGSHVTLRNTKLTCAAYELEGETYSGNDFAFEDRGGNSCGCPTAAGKCVAESAGIMPPDPHNTSE